MSEMLDLVKPRALEFARISKHPKVQNKPQILKCSIYKRFLILSILLILLDQSTKLFFKDKHYLIINYSINSGALFGLFKDVNTLLIIFSVLILAIISICFFVYEKKSAFVFIFSGILSNLIDRILFGQVRDFIDLKFWPIFNLADLFSIIGIIILIFPGREK